MTALKNLVAEIVDYAGLFPPASLSLEQVAQNFAEYRSGNYAWMLARLIMPAGQLADLEQLDSFRNSTGNWRISALVPPVDAADQMFAQAMQAISVLNQRSADDGDPRVIVDTIEIRASTLDQVEKTIADVPGDLNVFIEIPHHPLQPELLEAIGNSGNRIFAKIRTGGVTEDLIPTVADVAGFIQSCARHDVGFKATAGLHHPLYGRYRLTYDEQPDMGTMFGFINVFAAAGIAFCCDPSVEILQSVLTESDPQAFSFTDEALVWRDQRISAREITRLRLGKAIAFGSCSFDEPTRELQGLGWLKKAEVA